MAPPFAGLYFDVDLGLGSPRAPAMLVHIHHLVWGISLLLISGF
jgi:hypothetical protein